MTAERLPLHKHPDKKKIVKFFRDTWEDMISNKLILNGQVVYKFTLKDAAHATMEKFNVYISPYSAQRISTNINYHDPEYIAPKRKEIVFKEF